MITADQLLAHAVGDYLIQSHWMATAKTNSSWAALAHATSYTLPFVVLTRSPGALATICITHFIIDRWRLARVVCWAKNWLSPAGYLPWSMCKATGYPPETPPWLAVWLMIVADNTLHILINGAAIKWMP